MRCGRVFKSKRKRKYCPTCWGTMSKEKEYTCAYCGKKFKRYYAPKRLKNQKLFFCSKHCRSVYYWTKAKEKVKDESN